MIPCKVRKAVLPACALLLSSATFAGVLDASAQKTDIAKIVSHQLSLNAGHAGITTQDVKEHIINHPDAQFIKINFAQLSLPEGAYIEVSNLEGTESYRYDHNDSDVKASMSVSSDTVKVTLVSPSSVQWGENHGVEIQDFYAGFSDFELAERAAMFESGDIQPNSTCGVNERQDVACWETSHPVEHERSRPVARLLIGGRSLCTAWRVGADNHMFTNNHCFSSAADTKNVEVWFNYQRTGCGTGTTNSTVKVNGDQLLATDYALDYTLFTVQEFEKIKQFGHFGLDANAQIQGERIFIPQHGAGNPKELAIESDLNSNGLCQIDQTVTAGRGSNTDMGYKCDTTGGSSGSPVLSAKNNNVIALHHYGNSTQCTTKLNRGTRIELIWPKVATHFGGVLPVGDNGNTGNNPPVALITTQCTELTCRFDSSGSSDSDGNIVATAWDFGDGTTSTTAGLVTHTYQQAGKYNVSLVVTDNDNAQDSAVVEVTVTATGNQAPVADFTYSANGLAVNFTDASTDDSGVIGYLWAFGDGNSSQVQNPSHAYVAAGTYPVTLTVTDAQGEQSTKSRSVVVTDSNCNVGAWDSSTVYLKGDQASQNGSVYEAKWWTQAQSPADYSSTWAVWKWLRNCN